SNQVCVGGKQSSIPCSSGCPQGTYCRETSCCPILRAGIIPSIPVIPPIGFDVPIRCPNGVVPTERCETKCSTEMICYQKWCCPAEQELQKTARWCAGGGTAIGSCSDGCPANAVCENNVCCSYSELFLACSSGLSPVQSCFSGCPTGTVCEPAGCCKIQPDLQPMFVHGPVGRPIFPGLLPYGKVSTFESEIERYLTNVGYVQSGNLHLQNLLMPCPDGSMAIQRCSPGCPIGYACRNEGCCRMPPCPTGGLATNWCNSPFDCHPFQDCIQSVCCSKSLRLCPTGQLPLLPCDNLGICFLGLQCIEGGCCPAVSCPRGLNSVGPCGIGGLCPPGSQCAGGLCCPFSTCPGGNSPFWGGQLPGGPCIRSDQCNGFAIGTATCNYGFCSCVPNSWSNGISCAFGAPPRWSPLTACSQFAKPCTIALHRRARKPILKADFNKDTEAAFWRPSEDLRRYCSTDNTCTPEELCLNSSCVVKKQIGDFNCVEDRECSWHCKHGYCYSDSVKDMTQCRCRKGFSLLGICFEKCPAGTEQVDDECQALATDEETLRKT
ncbi:unnamed protein product, partial [Soboliphyme baturini]|uniref:EB domain-containing protein n=1 Tax=Soboliphyme baturini TaxID=241478 RepID=A0A183J4T0_9BILA